LILNGGVRSNNSGTLRLPVAIAKPPVILPASIDHIDDGLRGDAAYDVRQSLGALPRSTWVDQDGADERMKSHYSIFP
jgi:hypothetical protein